MAILTSINNLPVCGDIVKRANIVDTSLCNLAEIEFHSGKIVLFHFCEEQKQSIDIKKLKTEITKCLDNCDISPFGASDRILDPETNNKLRKLLAL